MLSEKCDMILYSDIRQDCRGRNFKDVEEKEVKPINVLLWDEEEGS